MVSALSDESNLPQSCEKHVYVHNVKSQVVNTSWAVLALLQAKYPDPEPIRRGCKLIMSRHLRDGSWAQESIEGGAPSQNILSPSAYLGLTFMLISV